MSDTTLLRLSPIGIPPYSARGVSQTLQPIAGAGQMRRTVNGTLVDISASQFRKYQSTITCRDMDHPALSGVWPGKVLTVDCITELSYEDVTDAVADRTIVPGSQRNADGFVFYRPRLTMMVRDYRVDTDEWGAGCGWTMELEEQ